jgi:hypothetical protein
VRSADDPTAHQLDQRSAGVFDIAMDGGQRRLAKVGAEDIVVAHHADRAWHVDLSPP